MMYLYVQLIGKALCTACVVILLEPAVTAQDPGSKMNQSRTAKTERIIADKPLYRDPMHDGAANPVIIWNRQAGKWFMYYTNRRANAPDGEGVAWVHGTRIGIATSDNGGVSWQYLDTCDIQYRVTGEYTFWAPEVIEQNRLYHMYLTYVPGIFSDWGHPRWIVHLTSEDGISWEFQSRLALASEKVLDACVIQMPVGMWRMWYNNEAYGKSMYYADSPVISSGSPAPGKTTGCRVAIVMWWSRTTRPISFILPIRAEGMKFPTMRSLKNAGVPSR